MSGFDWRAVPAHVRAEPTRSRAPADVVPARSANAFAAALDGKRGEHRAGERGDPRPARNVERDARQVERAGPRADQEDGAPEPPPGTSLPLAGVSGGRAGPAGSSHGSSDAAAASTSTDAGETRATPAALAVAEDVTDADGAGGWIGNDPTELPPNVSVGDAVPLSPVGSPPPLERSSAGDTASAVGAAAIGNLMDELRALDAPASGRWRFALPGAALGIDSIVLSRGDGGQWNLRLGTERARANGSRAGIDELREALRARGHEVGEIAFGSDADAEGAA